MKNWSIQIDDAAVHGAPVKGTFEGDFDIKFKNCCHGTKPEEEDYEYHIISTEKWYQLWEKDDNYLPQRLSELTNFMGSRDKTLRKIEALEKEVTKNHFIDAPHLTATHDEACPKVSDGRHRIWLIHKLGIKFFPAAIPKNRVKPFRKYNLIVS